jgi:hypothetical protein
MRVVNRTAVTITGAQPFIDWMRDTDADFNKGALTVRRAKAYGSASRPSANGSASTSTASWSTWRTMTSKERNCNAVAPREL